MNFYESIARYYEYIFPYNPMHLNFILEASKEDNNLSVLDIGCAAGELCLHLSADFNRVVGIDLDRGMLDKAKGKVQNSDNIEFRNLDMLKIGEEFGAQSFDLISCFGNTLVHLNSEENILSFFKQARKVLAKNGKLLFQIINYDRIIDHNIGSLAAIDNEEIRFERNYNIYSDNNMLDFDTILTIKKSGVVIKNSIQLLPIRKREVEQLLGKAGFSEIDVYGGFNRDNFDGNSVPMIIEAG